MKRVLLYILGLIWLLSCSQTEQLTSTKLTLLSSDTVEGGTLAGGYALVVKNIATGEQQFRAIKDAAMDLQLELINGKWDFYVVGWTGAPLTSSPKCGFLKSVSLEGFPIDIKLSISDAGCSDSFFAAKTLKALTPVKFSNINFNSCLKFTDASLNPVSASVTCSPIENGTARSYQVILKSYHIANANKELDSENIASGCLKNISTSPMVNDAKISPSSGTSAYMTELNIPDQQAFHIAVRAYDLDQCAGGFQEYDFPIGLANGYIESDIINPVTKLFYLNGTYRLFLRPDTGAYCERNKGVRPFASSGTGGSTGAYDSDRHLLCNHHQLNSIGGSSFASNSYKKFKIIREINYVEDMTSGFDEANFVELIPIGQDIDTNPLTSTQFTGLLDGSGFYVKAMELSDKQISHKKLGQLGLIRNLGANGIVRNLKLLLPSIRFARYNGVIADDLGIVAGKSNGKIENVFVEYGDLSGNSRVGGLVGYQEGGQILKSQVLNAQINAFSHAGGIVGLTEDLGAEAISRVKSTGQIIGENQPLCMTSHTNQADCNTAGFSWNEYVEVCYKTTASVPADCSSGGLTWLEPIKFGGIAGESRTCIGLPAHITQATSSMLISTYGTVGGISGYNDDCKIENSYSTSSLFASYATDARVGGVVGFNEAGGVIDKTFHTSGALYGAMVMDGIANGAGGCTNSFGTTSATVCVGGGKTQSEIRDDVTFGSFNLSPANTNTSTIWKMEDLNDYPRLSWEAPRACQGRWGGLSGGGTGTELDPYWVCSQNHFISINAAPNKHFKLMNEIDLSGMSNKIAIPSIFTGVLDGNNLSITNFMPVVNADGAGLFGEVGRVGVIKNLKVLGPRLSAPNYNDVSALVKTLRGGLVENVKVYGGYIHSGTNAGFLAATNLIENYMGVNYFGRIMNSYVDGDIEIDNAEMSAGLIAGVNNGIIKYVKSEGSVKGPANIGGIVGDNTGVIYGAMSYADVAPNSSGAQNIGGIAGNNDVGPSITIENYGGDDLTYATAGAIVESSFDGSFNILIGHTNVSAVGGIVGANNSDAIIENCSSSFHLSDATQNGTTPSTNTVGGIAGYSDGIVSNSVTSAYYNLTGGGVTNVSMQAWGTTIGDGNFANVIDSFAIDMGLTSSNTNGTILTPAQMRTLAPFETAAWDIVDGDTFDDGSPSVWIHYGDWMPKPAAVERGADFGHMSMEKWMELMNYYF